MGDTMPSHASLTFPAEDGIECERLIEILEQVKDVHYRGGLPLRITDLSLNDHHLKIVLAS